MSEFDVVWYVVMLLSAMAVAGIVGYDIRGRDASQQTIVVLEFASTDGASEFMLTFDEKHNVRRVIEEFEEIGFKFVNMHDVDMILDEQYEGCAVLCTGVSEF
jgi:hypothetical protein